MAELVSARSYRSTQAEARSLNFVGHPSPPMTDSCTLRFSGIAHHHIPHRRPRTQSCQRSRLSDCRGRWHLQGALRRRQQRPERQLGFAGWRLSLPDLREHLEAGRVRYQTGWLAGGGDQRRDSLQQPGGFDGILISLHGDAMTRFSPLTLREDLLQRKCCRCLRKSTDLPRDKRTTESGCRSRGEFNCGQAMPGTSGMYYCVFTPSRPVGGSQCSMQCHHRISPTN
jgi:hypothetical protein